ncbi:hypothetical protein MKW92_008947 [Papaver armeniacum]|nr:hypothetical protein MKW92_008947 [Papaver armeniacum]
MGKFPPGLRSNLFPKFDLEDNADSRFDSLVGSEGLLGVQSQEENPWIEDFSGGSSGIGFCPTAAESCSISRRNNVWSEATSLESVEMLLKSVGQDEMIMGQTTTVIEESISKDRLGYLTTQMGLQNSDKDGSIASSKGLDVPNVNSVLPTHLRKEAANQILPLFEPTDGITGNGSNKKNEKRQGNVSIQSVTGYTSSLNTQIPACALFQHPFTNYQQVQLRAQIHVYGSLIREAAPDERCMVFSFGESDGGRSTWETEWLVALTRVQLQSDTFSTPDRAGGVGARPTMISPIAPTLSPSGLVQQLALTPSTRARVGNSTSVSARAPSSTSFHEFQHPFTNYQQVQLRAQIHVYGSLIREAAPDELCMVFSFGESDGGRSTWETEWLVALTRVQLQSDTFSTPDRAGGVGARPTMISPITPTLSPSGLVQQLALTPSTRARVGNSTSVSARSPSSILDVKRTPPPLGKQASVQWAKGSASLEIDQISSVVQPTLAPEPVSSLGDGHQLPTTSVTSIAEDPSSFDPNVSATSSFSLTTASPTPPRLSVHVLACPVDTEQLSGIVLSDETCRQIDQAQRQEEKASFLAAAAVNHSRSVWTQLAIQKSSGLVADREAKLASAAVTIAAAAAVAKAAAAGAKIASDAALQAKLMADEVLILPCELGKSTSDECLHSGLKNMVNFISPASILKGKDRSNISDSILVAAREAAQKRVEAALAATRRAKNWDAVIKAAGMAAEAVSQASTVTAMGEPIPFTLQELSEAGPENYWKLQRRHMFSDQIAKPNSCATNMAKQLEVVCGEEEVTRCIEHNSEETEGTPGQGRKAFPPHELSKQVENSNLLVNGMLWGPAWDSEKGLIEPKPGKTSGFDETIGAAPKSQVKSIRALQNAQSEGYGEAQESAQTSTENQIGEGSVLEVLSCEEGLGGGCGFRPRH